MKIRIVLKLKNVQETASTSMKPKGPLKVCPCDGMMMAAYKNPNPWKIAAPILREESTTAKEEANEADEDI